MNTEKLTWYIARSGGIVAWLLLALGLLVGLLLSSKVLGRRVSPAWTLSIHRYLGGLSVIFTTVHVAAVMLDDFVDFGIVDVLVPGASAWSPGAVAWGIVGMYVLIAVEVTSLLMRRIPKRLWRVVHWSSAVLFVTATVHGWKAGTDAGRAFIAAISTAIVVLSVLTVVRVVTSRRASRRIDVRTVALDDLRIARAARDHERPEVDAGPGRPSTAGALRSSGPSSNIHTSIPPRGIDEPSWRPRATRRISLHALQATASQANSSRPSRPPRSAGSPAHAGEPEPRRQEPVPQDVPA